MNRVATHGFDTTPGFGPCTMRTPRADSAGMGRRSVMAKYDYVIADVFTDVAFGGNQLAVFPDAAGLAPEVMQKIAREFNFAESTFVVPATRPDCAAQIRIFTPKREMPFAGHPTIGTAAVMAYLKRDRPDPATGITTYQEGIGPVAVRVGSLEGRTLVAEFTLQSPLERADRDPERRDVARALGLAEHDILETWSAGIGIRFCFVRVASRAAVDAAMLDRQAWSATLAQAWAPQLYFFSGDVQSGSTLHARMFAPALGVDEDPATGSACVTLVACLAERAQPAERAHAPDGTFSIKVNQGVAMGRPSALNAYADRAGGQTTQLRLGGASVIVAEGRFEV